jgi:hypothetical protein
MAKKLYLGAGDLLDAVRRARVVRTIRLRLTNKRIWSKVVFTRPLPVGASDGRLPFVTFQRAFGL